MAANRLEVLRDMVSRNPNDSFARYGLAMEQAGQGNLAEAVEEFRRLLAINPNYPAAYFHGGQALEKLGRRDEAAELYRRGIEVSAGKGDLHTRSELKAALAELGG